MILIVMLAKESKKGRMVDILAARGEEGRGQTAKSSGELLSEL